MQEINFIILSCSNFMKKNLWTESALALSKAYTGKTDETSNVGSSRFQVVTRALLMHLSPKPQRIVDVGGGFGQQAIMLARSGHFVVIVDIDSNMLTIAEKKLAYESEVVRSRIKLVLGDGEDSVKLVGTNFDLACCHSVLMYEEDPAPMLSNLINLVHQDGLISVLSLNTESMAMRSGLQGRWKEAIMNLEVDSQIEEDKYLPSYDHSREYITEILSGAGASILDWYGVGIFTDHLDKPISDSEFEEAYLAEWLAGKQDPYRQIARCFHLLAQRN
jgi:S-adenosylmethionine-dependent methyltransferase